MAQGERRATNELKETATMRRRSGGGLVIAGKLGGAMVLALVGSWPSARPRQSTMMGWKRGFYIANGLRVTADFPWGSCFSVYLKAWPDDILEVLFFSVASRRV